MVLVVPTCVILKYSALCKVQNYYSGISGKCKENLVPCGSVLFGRNSDALLIKMLVS